MTEDCKRKGTTTLFAALETVQGKVIGQCYQRNWHQDFLTFCANWIKSFPAKLRSISSWTTMGLISMARCVTD
jgi:hypothetical protein